MSTPAKLPLLPLAIVVAGALVGGGLYFGLSAARVPATVPPRAVAVAAPPAEAEVQAEVARALLLQRGPLLERCRSDAAPAPYLFQIAVSPDGVELARGIGEVRGASRADLAECLRHVTLPPLHVRAPGRALTVEVKVTLP